MSISITFPYSAISDFGLSEIITGSVTVSVPASNLTVTEQFSLAATNWAQQARQQDIRIELDDSLLIDSEMVFTIDCKVAGSNNLVLIHAPNLIRDHVLDASLLIKKQQVTTTDFLFENTSWNNIPLKDGQQAEVTLQTCVNDTIKSVVGFVSKDIVFREELTYVSKQPNKAGLTVEENIEYYLGKDSFKNLFFSQTLPTAWDIPPRPKNPFTKINQSIQVTGFFPGDPTTYNYNNLGYRSLIDFDHGLQDKPIILCLGDSDAFGVGVDYSNIWSSKLQQQYPDAVVINMSVPGISIDGIARIGYRAISVLGKQLVAVCTQYSPASLREFVSKNYQGGVHTHRNYNLPYQDWWKHIDWQSNNYSFFKNKVLLDSVCASHSVPHYDLYINKNDGKVPYDAVEYGVYTSIGPQTHQAIANYFYKKITQKPSLFQTSQS